MFTIGLWRSWTWSSDQQMYYPMSRWLDHTMSVWNSNFRSVNFDHLFARDTHNRIVTTLLGN
jgi:hypothetical protein